MLLGGASAKGKNCLLHATRGRNAPSLGQTFYSKVRAAIGGSACLLPFADMPGNGVRTWFESRGLDLHDGLRFVHAHAAAAPAKRRCLMPVQVGSNADHAERIAAEDSLGSCGA